MLLLANKGYSPSHNFQEYLVSISVACQLLAKLLCIFTCLDRFAKGYGLQSE